MLHGVSIPSTSKVHTTAILLATAVYFLQIFEGHVLQYSFQFIIHNFIPLYGIIV
jgi:hypothetical protein